MDIKFSEDQMRAIVTKAILEGLGADQQSLLIQKAIEALMGPAQEAGRSYYDSDKRSKLERAFDEAVRTAVLDVARAELAKPEWNEKLRALVVTAAEKAFAVDRMPRLIEGLSHALADMAQKVARD